MLPGKPLRTGFEMLFIARSLRFDAEYYRQCYTDVNRYRFPPLLHYCRHGWKEGRNPRPDFSTVFYLQTYPDVEALGVNPFAHYLRYGQKESRLAWNPPPPLSAECSAEPETEIFPAGRPRIFRKPRPTGPRRLISIQKEIETEPVDVSVVLPTKNAGDGFVYLLEMLTKQKGFRRIEIIVVDSGSSDDTIRTAKRYNAVVINIPSERFSHSYARNLGAEKATGQYLLFTVQDALPPSETWLNELFEALKRNDVAAVSCIEAAREDADLFYRAISWNHYRFLEVSDTDRILSLPEKPTPITLRKNGQLSDIACLIARDVLLRYRFAGNYAEDLDLGIRLIGDGHRLAFLSSTKVLHSHNRPASYHLKRFYVDTLFLASRFPGSVPGVSIGIAQLRSEIIAAYGVLEAIVVKDFKNLALPSRREDVAWRVKDRLHRPQLDNCPTRIDPSGNPYLDSPFVVFLEKHILDGTGAAAISTADNLILQTLSAYADMIFEYLSKTCDWIDEAILEDIAAALFKAYAAACGAQIARCQDTLQRRHSDAANAIDKTLRQGV